MRQVLLSLLVVIAVGAPAAADVILAGSVAVPGNATDLFRGAGVNQNRLGGFGSGLIYDRVKNEYISVNDRGPGGGLFSYKTRLQVFSLDINAMTGAPNNFVLKKTIPLVNADGSAPFNGLAPGRLNGNSHVLGLSLDPEGLAVGPNGHYYVCDEYGSSLYEFAPVDIEGGTQARFVRAFTIPDRLLPRDALGNVDYDAVRAPPPLPGGMPNLDAKLVSGRQDNRGFEGVTITPDGTKLWVMLQGPLAEEGASDEGRRSRNTRLVEFDIATGTSGRQFIYQLTDIAQVNARIDLTNRNPAADILPTGQGQSVLVSDLVAINDHEFLVLERDGRGVGGDNPAGADPVASAVGIKHVYHIDITGATDVSGISLKRTNSLTTPVLPGNPDPPITITPVAKRSFFDLLRAIQAAGLPVPDKVEGITWGPVLSDGRQTLILTSDNDFSVTRVVVKDGGRPVDRQFEVYTMGNETRYTDLDDLTKSYVNISDPLGANYLVDQGPLPPGFKSVPTYIYSIAVARARDVDKPAGGFRRSAGIMGFLRRDWPKYRADQNALGKCRSASIKRRHRMRVRMGA